MSVPFAVGVAGCSTQVLVPEQKPLLFIADQNLIRRSLLTQPSRCESQIIALASLLAGFRFALISARRSGSLNARPGAVRLRASCMNADAQLLCSLHQDVLGCTNRVKGAFDYA